MKSNTSDLSPLAQSTLRDLISVWLKFELDLPKVPIIKRLYAGHFTSEDYLRLLKNLRQQVVEGARWISRAASSLDRGFLDERSIVIGHAREEHRDYEILERDFMKAGGTLESIRTAEKNIGSEALHAFLMNEASHPNPIQMIGAMFIIEGLGEKMASSWAEMIKEQTDLPDEALTFLKYHGANDEHHMEKLHQLLNTPSLDERSAARVVKVAKVVARLYRLQLEELDHV
jgi:pyrroloquinoline quinone (PQQ) biosynthesis protein C